MARSWERPRPAPTMATFMGLAMRCFPCSAAGAEGSFSQVGNGDAWRVSCECGGWAVFKPRQEDPHPSPLPWGEGKEVATGEMGCW